MAPPPAYALAAPRRRPSPRAPVPTLDSASFRRYLLTKRVLSLEEFRQEMLNKWSSSSTAAPASKAIPVPLYPGETLHQYTFKFKKWLADKGEELGTMRNDPNRERSFWHSFAHHRVGTLSTLMTPPGAHPKGQKRSVEDEYDGSYHRSAPIERKRVRREEARDTERGFHSRASMDVAAAERPVYFVSSRSGGVVDDADTLLLPPRQSVARLSDSVREYRSSSRERDFHYEAGPHYHRSPSLSSQSSREEAPRSSRTRSRTEILSRRVLSARDYLREIKERKQTPRPAPRNPEERLTKIPVPLFPGETMYDYDQAFKLWLAQRHTSLAVLRTQPLKERVYRHQYARQKVMWKNTKLARPPPGTSSSRALPQERGVPVPTRANDVDSLDGDGPSSAGAPSPMPASSKKPVAVNHDGKHIAHHPSCSLAQTGRGDIPSNESGESTPTSQTHDPTPQLDAQTRKPATISKSVASGTKQLTGIDEEKRYANDMVTEGDIEHPTTVPTSIPSPESLPPWAQLLIDRVHELEKKVTRLQEEVDRCHAPGGNCGTRRGPDLEHKVECNGEAASSPIYKLDKKSKSAGDLAKNILVTEPMVAKWLQPQSGDDTWGNTNPEAAGIQRRAPSNEDIYRDATVKLARAVQSRVAEDAEQRRLTEEYDRLNELIMMNETAIDDALAYVKAIKEVDEASALEHQSQIMELVVSINQEKERRASALAAMIVYSWSGREDELVSLLDVEISQAHSDEAKHEKCAAISSQIEEKDSELETLEMQMNDQLQSVSALAASASDTNRNSQFKALEELSGKLSELQTAKESLEEDRRETLMCFLRGDEIRKLVMNSVRGARRIKAQRSLSK